MLPVSHQLLLFFAVFLQKTGALIIAQDGPLVVSPDQSYKIQLKSASSAPLNVRLHSDNASTGFYALNLHSESGHVRIAMTSDVEIYGTYSSGKDAGLVLFPPSSGMINTYCAAETLKTSALIVPVSYPKLAPIPGACCSVCALEMDASFKVETTSWFTSIRFERANVYHNSKTKIPCDSISGTSQDIQSYRLEYTFHVLYFGSRKYSQWELFDALWKMSSPDLIRKHSQEGGTVKGANTPQMKAVRMVGQGVVYNIIVRDPLKGTEAAYIPYHSYGCNITDTASCLTPYSDVPLQLAACIVGSIIGIVMCYFGHKLVPAQMFFGATVFGTAFSYVVIDYASEWTLIERVACAVACGAVLGCLDLLLWSYRKSLISLCLMPNALLVCLLVNCAIFFSSIGTLPIWSNRNAYWLTVCGIVFLPSAFLISTPKFLSIMNTSTLGSFGFIVMISFFVRCNLGYMVLDFFLRSSLRYDHNAIFLGRPFMDVDYILCGIWACLALSGVIVQCYTSKKKRRSPSDKRRHNSRRHDEQDERTRLLDNEGPARLPGNYQSTNSTVNVV